jgi:hypothetical protein
MLKPIEIFNNIVNGIILGLYDVAILAIVPLIAPLVRRRYRVWKFILKAESRLSSLTLMFVFMAGVVTIDAPGLLDQLVKQHALITQKTTYGFISVLFLCVVLTIFFDVLLRLLVYFRRLSLKVVFSNVRLAVLRLYFCTGLLAVLLVHFLQFVAMYRSENRGFHQGPPWADHVSLLLICLATIPFSATILHLTHRWRGWPKWLVIAPFTYSFVNIALSIGAFLGFIFFAFMIFVIDPEQIRLYAFNTRCRMMDADTVAVESDLLLKTDWFDAVALENVFAEIENQIIELNDVDGIATILISGKVVRAKWLGKLLEGVDKPKLGAQPAPCSLQTYGIFWREPERVEIIRGD